jgi:hypothetical protein
MPPYLRFQLVLLDTPCYILDRFERAKWGDRHLDRAVRVRLAVDLDHEIAGPGGEHLEQSRADIGEGFIALAYTTAG